MTRQDHSKMRESQHVHNGYSTTIRCENTHIQRMTEMESHGKKFRIQMPQQSDRTRGAPVSLVLIQIQSGTPAYNEECVGNGKDGNHSVSSIIGPRNNPEYLHSRKKKRCRRKQKWVLQTTTHVVYNAATPPATATTTHTMFQNDNQHNKQTKIKQRSIQTRAPRGKKVTTTK